MLRLNHALRPGDEIAAGVAETTTGDNVLVGRQGQWAVLVVPTPTGSRQVPAPVDCHPAFPEGRDELSVSIAAGAIVDTFAAQINALEQKRLGDEFLPGSSVKPTVSFNLEYRLSDRYGPLWLSGRALYASRSRAELCRDSAEVQSKQCEEATDVAKINQVFEIVQRAGSAETYFGLRWEFAPLRRNSSAPARGYVDVELGGIFLKGVSEKVLVNHHIAGGVIFTTGRFRGSYLEAGVGENETFAPDQEKWNRKKVDFLLIGNPSLGSRVRNWKNVLATGKPFVRVNLDMSKGVDSLQTSFGAVYDFGSGATGALESLREVNR